MRIQVSEISNRASAINRYLLQLDNVFSQIISSVSRFSQNDSLTGYGYMSAKIYYRTVYTSIAYGFIRANEALREANSKVAIALNNGLDKIDTDEIQRAMTRIQAYQREMQEVRENKVFDLFGFHIEYNRVDRSAEIAAEERLIAQIQVVIRADSAASGCYSNFNSIVTDLKQAIAKMNDVVFKRDAEYDFRSRGSEFNFKYEDLKPFLNLMIDENGNLFNTKLVQDEKYLTMLEDASFRTPWGYQDNALFMSIISINSGKYNDPYTEATLKGNIATDFRSHFTPDIIDHYYRNTFWRYNVNNDRAEWQCTTYSFGRMLELYGLNYWDVKVNVRHVGDRDIRLNTLTGMPLEHEDRDGGNAGDWVDNMKFNKENGELYYDFTTPESKNGQLTIEDVNVGDWIIWKVADNKGNILTNKYGHIATIEGIDYANHKVIYSEGNWGYNPYNQAGIYVRTIPFDENGVLINGTGDFNASEPGFYTRDYTGGNHYVLQGVIHTNEVLQNDASGNVTVVEQYAENSVVRAPVA